MNVTSPWERVGGGLCRWGVWLALGVATSAGAFESFISMRDGYLYDAGAGKAWVPHGIAYQTWNRPLGVWQTFEQIDYDLDEMVKMGANSIRVDFVWQHIEEQGDNVWSWANYDYLVQACEQRGIRIFALIGYQWPPNWFPDAWYTMHPPEYDAGGIYHGGRWPSDIINYEHPDAIGQYKEFFANVCARYKDSKAIVAWIVGNEYGFLGLWSGLLDGYDPQCEQAFRTWCQGKYGSISNVNATWGTSYPAFSNIVFVEVYREYGPEGAQWADMVQWREDSIAQYTAAGAAAARAADTNHLLSYSTVGMQWGEEDWRYHAEDRGKITRACAATNAALSFFSVNNYPWSILGHESQNGQWGISYTKKVTISTNDPEGMPVLYSETGFTSSETMWPGMNEARQGPLVRNALWESLEAGAIGTHIFAWHDRPYITDREKGFGILYADRNVKQAFWVSRDTYLLMDQVKIHDLLRGSKDPKPDIAFLWTAANDSQYNRYECEMQQIGGALERLGYEPNFLNLEDLASGVYTNYKVIILPRNLRVDSEVPGTGKGVMRFLREDVLTKGIHLLASADLPGRQDQNGNPRADYSNELAAIFGIDGSSLGGFEVAPRTGNFVASNTVSISVVFSNTVGPVTNGYRCTPRVWKYNDEVRVLDGTVWATMDLDRNKGFEQYHTNWIPGWYTWGSPFVTNWFPLDGSNMVGMTGSAGLWQDVQAAAGGTYEANTYLRSNPDDPLRGGAYASIAIEFHDDDDALVGQVESERLMGSTTSQWRRFSVTGQAPTNAVLYRRVIRYDSTTNVPQLLVNGGLNGSGAAPTGWNSWNDANHDSDTGTYRSASPAWRFWWESGLWQDVTVGFKPGDSVSFGGYLRSPSWAPMGAGKRGTIEVEFYNGAVKLSSVTAAPPVEASSTQDVWILSQANTTVPGGANLARVIVRCNAAGSGQFLADDLFFKSTTPGGGVYVDDVQRAPAVVVKNHGTAKAAIFLFSAGDMLPDGDNDGEMDVLPWKWRYDYFGAVVRDYFGVQPPLQTLGTNAYLCLAEYRTCTNGATLWQVKNYLYDRFHPNNQGGDPLTFTIQSSLFNGRNIRAFEQGRVLETNSDGTIQITLPPDGQEMLLAYTPGTNNTICQIVDAPAVIHPFGDKNYSIKVAYDTQGKTGLVLKLALIGGLSNQVVYQVIGTNVTGAGQETFWMWIPDPNQNDPNYASTPDGGEYTWQAWLEDASSNQVASAVPQDTQLKWGIQPLAGMPSTLTKGGTTNLPVEWEELYEYLYWQHCPMARNDAFPTRVALFRSTKTEQQFPGHFERVNEVCNWLESLGYSNGNPMDVSFDNVMVSTGASTGAPSGPVYAFSDDLESGATNWTASGLWHLATDLSSSPTHSWAYNNGTNYNTGARTTGSVVTAWIDLTGAGGATLTFRSWYETEDTGTSWDKKLVYASTDGTNWTQVLQISGVNREWVTASCDLSAFAGQQIKLRFTFDSVDHLYNVYKGWYLDDVRVAVQGGGTSDVFADNMEATTNWTAQGLWRLATNRFSSATKSWVYNNGTNYNTGARNSGGLLSCWIDLTSVSRATLSFKSWYRTEDTGTAWDRKLLYVTTDGTNWTQILQVSGPDQQWTTQTLDLSPYAGRSIRLRFFFDTIDALLNQFEGWYVDDVRITTIASGGVALFSDAVESGTNGWAAAGLWHQAADLYASAGHSWAYNNGVNYNTGARNSGTLVSPWIDLTLAGSAQLSFQSWYETEDTGTTWDKKLVHVSTDGVTWAQALQVSGPNRQWVTKVADLSAYAGQRIKVRFTFDTIDGIYNAYRGWYVDDITVRMASESVLFYDAFSGGLSTNWTRVAGAANWAVQGGALRAWRIGNDDNLLCAGNPAWSNVSVGADLRYNRKGPYLNDLELYLRYQDRGNFVKVLVENFYGFWRLKYIVRLATNNINQGWIYEFSKTNQPAEGTWYNLRVDAEGTNYTVYLDGKQVGAFGSPAAFPYTTGRIAVGTRAEQLGIWEPAKGYFFIDDDEYSYYSAATGGTGSQGYPLNLDWGYLRTFYNTLILPSTFVMSDVEVSNVVTWLHGGTYSLLATDGGIARKDENGNDDLGRIEPIFGVEPAVTAISGLNRLTIGDDDHYVTLDYQPADQLTVAGAGTSWTTPTNASDLGVADNGSSSIPAVLCNLTGPDVWSPSKAFCFNFPADTAGQLTGTCRRIAQRAFEWSRGEAHRVLAQLKYSTGNGENYDFMVAEVKGWVLGGTGSTNLVLSLPTDGIMTGTNLYWVMYDYPWDDVYPWGAHAGFYSSANDGAGKFVTIPGLGLQIIGAGNKVFAGREWDLWVAWNVGASNYVGEYGIKDRGGLTSEDNFNDGNYAGWTVAAHPNVSWSVVTGALRATVVGATGGYAYITRNGLNVTGRNVTMEYMARFMNGATNGGMVFAGRVLYVNPQLCGWDDQSPAWSYTNVVVPGAWNHVRLNIRDGDPYLRSDLFVNDRVVFVDEPIEVTNWTSTSVGFLSSYWTGSTEWDNFRVADEQYALVTQAVTGVYVPTNSFWPFVPDYDPGSWEHEGSALGAQYEWYFYLRGGDAHSYSNTAVYFAPRLMVEHPLFPTNMHPGQTVQLPVEWESLEQVPAAMTVKLEDPYVGTGYVSQVFTVTNASGTGWFPVTLPAGMPAGDNYLWVSYMHPTGSVSPFLERVGLDDTFRFSPQGTPVEPETVITVTPAPGDELAIYNDYGLPLGCDVYKWSGSSAVWEGHYTNIVPPEGRESFYCSGTYWQGWGVFKLNGGARDHTDMSAYADGFIKFWVKSTTSLELALEDYAGVNRIKAIASSGGVWKEYAIPVSDFGTSLNLSQMYGLFKITAAVATTFYIDNVRWVRGVYRVYRDFGIPADCTNLTWAGGPATFDAAYLGDTPPEGSTCYRASSGSWSRWGVFKTNTQNMTAYSNGYLRFWAKSTNALKVQIEGPQGTSRTNTIPSTAGNWQEFQIAISNFSGINLSQVYGLFSISSTTGATYLVDDVSWTRSTNVMPGIESKLFYSDEGIPPASDIFVWWASQYWAHVSAATNDGGFEQSAAGSFPNAGYWQPASAGGSATAQCLAAALRTGARGLRARTGTDAGATWCAPYQACTAVEEDVFRAEAWIRQPSGQGWVAGSEAFVRMSFYDAWYGLLSTTSSAARVTAAAQGWTQCSIPDTKAPPGAAFLRLETVVQKPGSAGESVADFDDVELRQGNSFYGQFPGDPSPPEGTKCFRSYCVNWSGWGIFYTNSTVDLSEYANGYLKFFLKSSGYTKVEIQSVAGGVTNTGIGAWYNPTTNNLGEVVWQHKVIPITNFTGVALANIKSPFMATDPTYDRAFYIDYVRWEKGP